MIEPVKDLGIKEHAFALALEGEPCPRIRGLMDLHGCVLSYSEQHDIRSSCGCTSCTSWRKVVARSLRAVHGF